MTLIIIGAVLVVVGICWLLAPTVIRMLRCALDLPSPTALLVGIPPHSWLERWELRVAVRHLTRRVERVLDDR